MVHYSDDDDGTTNTDSLGSLGEQHNGLIDGNEFLSNSDFSTVIKIKEDPPSR